MACTRRTNYSVARVVHSGIGHQLCAANVQVHTQSRLYPNAVTRNGLLAYIHPPFEVLLYLSLTYRPYPMAYFTWGTVNILPLLLTLRVLLPYIPERNPLASSRYLSQITHTT